MYEMLSKSSVDGGCQINCSQNREHEPRHWRCKLWLPGSRILWAPHPRKRSDSEAVGPSSINSSSFPFIKKISCQYWGCVTSWPDHQENHGKTAGTTVEAEEGKGKGIGASALGTGGLRETGNTGPARQDKIELQLNSSAVTGLPSRVDSSRRPFVLRPFNHSFSFVYHSRLFFSRSHYGDDDDDALIIL